MHIHTLGICGTFMGSLAQLAAEKGFKVTGCDQNVYPPMSDQLRAAGIELIEGYDHSQISLKPDLWVIGNAISRGNPLLEAILNQNLSYSSGPQFLAQHVLQGKWVVGVSGTHGKTTTTSMLAWVLEYAGLNPGFLIGGVPGNFQCSARLGGSDFFVIEADEYDTAFFDKRSKFVHYQPRTLIINNLEFDHADIFNDLSEIQKQFHHLVRTIPSDGMILCLAQSEPIKAVLDMGCWTPVETLGSGGDWEARCLKDDYSEFEVTLGKEQIGTVRWTEFGEHNVNNALAVISAARSLGIEPEVSCEALGEFRGVKRRMEMIGHTDGLTIYDDFAHHPTAIATTLDGLRKRVADERIVAIIEPRSNTMKAGVHRQTLAESATSADLTYWYQPPGLDWSLEESINGYGGQRIEQDFDTLLRAVALEARQGGHFVIMSNGGFSGFHQKLLERIGL